MLHINFLLITFTNKFFLNSVIMKKIITILILSTFLACCNKDEKSTALNPIDQLPPATQTGANTAGCLVNGEVFLPKGNSFGGPILSCFYQQDSGGYHLGLGISNKINGNLKSIIISLNPDQLNENLIYNLTSKTYDINNDFISNFGTYTIYSNTTSDNSFETKSTLNGEIKITKLNTTQRIISGTFWYDAINPQGEIVKVRDGRFDMHYVN